MTNNLSNTVTVLGNYNEIPTSISSQALVVAMIDGLTVTKTADKIVWADGVLTYTIEVDNKALESYTSPTITDVLDISLISFVNDSVTIDGAKAEESKYTYNDADGTLTISIPDIAASGKCVVTFQVSKK